MTMLDWSPLCSATTAVLPVIVFFLWGCSILCPELTDREGTAIDGPTRAFGRRTLHL